MFEITPPPRGDGVTDMGGQIMGFLCEHPDQELFQKDVEKMFCIRRSTASQFLKDLERDGMILRRPVPQDARLKKLVVTEKARAIHMEVEEKAHMLEQMLTAGLSQEEIERFLEIARKIQRNLSQ